MKSPTLAACASLLLTCHVQASLPKAYTTTYQVKYRGFTVGTAQRTLTMDHQGNYQYSLSTRSHLGLITLNSDEESIGSWANADLPAPGSYRLKKSTPLGHESLALIFDWDKHSFTSETLKKHKPILTETPLLPNTQDPLSYQLGIWKELNQNHREFTYQLAKNDHIKTYYFEVTGQSTLDTALGKVDTLIVVRKSDDGSRLTRLWVAPKMDYMLVRILEERDGKPAAEANIQTIQWLTTLEKHHN